MKVESVPEAPVPAIFSVTGNAHSNFPDNLGVKIKEEVIYDDSPEYAEEKQKKDDIVIQVRKIKYSSINRN